MKEKAEKVSFSTPAETREFPLGKVDLVSIGGAMLGKATFQPGWKWSTSIKETAKTNSCLAPHFQYHLAGHLRIQMDDGQIIDCFPGDVSLLPEGHDAWVIGNEPVVVVDFQGMLDYAKSNTNK
ncbi:MAG: cupin domain-containing protein [Saprospiraceae bacterium]|nr:cupin domain-containing protein [Saprospiraceae bacterium]